MKRLFAILPLLLVVGFAVSACGGSTPVAAPNEVQMDDHDFLQTAVTIKAGESIRFSDLANGGGLHIICSGEQGKCSDDPNAPADLGGNGFQIQAGQTKDVTFTQAGTYKVTCTIHPDMNVTITVQ